ncbi:hypothetical protein FJQ98_01920 [Lysinibacillus agricola]|uniref:Uncharacterized protein n=1 Tax=Lysinibacillus agricola TaxID=2590012 RepID=A0ABX7ASE4_9BACI|nr:hypothetical protein [Lysinibacillus agricola]QQP12870.1 hypothetical protein FJQ98_01920 [Lysinibacillus agricola]
MRISNRGTKAKTITSCDNAFVTNIGAAGVKRLIGRPQEALRESEASAANVFCSESKAPATKRPVGTEINPTL